MAFLSFLSAYLDSLVQQRRASSDVQAQQAPASQFAAAWNAAQLRLPAQYLYEQLDPVSGQSVVCAPWCDASVSDDGRLLLALTLRPDAPIDSSVLAAHAEDVRRIARGFFQVGMRTTGVDAHRQTLQLALAPVRPQVDSTGAILLGFDDTGEPVRARFIGEVTAISGIDRWCLPWVASSYAAIEQQALDSATAIASTRAAVRQARAGAEMPYMLIDVGDSPCEETARPEPLKNLAATHRGIVEWSRGAADPDRWAIRPTQILRRTGGTYELECAGRTLTFTPAWLY